MDDYEQRQEKRRERLERASEGAASEAGARFKRAGEGLPDNGQPILVGHHSEGRHRAAIARSDANMRKGIEAQERAKELARRAAAVGTGGISSDDPEAVAKLRDEHDALVEKRERMKRENAAWRKEGEAGLVRLGMHPEAAHRFAEKLKAANWIGDRIPWPAYSLTNIGANIRRIAKRIEELSAEPPSLETVEEHWGKLEARPDINRVAITPARRLSEATFKALKSAGWRWSPTERAFLRHLNNAGVWAARCALAVLRAEQTS